MFDNLAIELHQTARSKGFYVDLDFQTFNGQAKQLAMIHSEVTEVLEALRKSQGDVKVVEEIADILIRCFDFMGALKQFGVIDSDISLDGIFAQKTETNKNRKYMHGVLG